jgi:uncharacterized membrane protein YphA (DoxX/SURF4 family)
MKTRQIIVEIICLILVLNFFYEGIHKIAYWSSYSVWLHYAPLLKPVWVPLTYVIPISEIILSIALLFPKYRISALNWSIFMLMVFVLWVISSYLFTHRIFWPYHALWKKPTWMQKILISIGLCWMSLIAFLLIKKKTLQIPILTTLFRKQISRPQ